MCIHTYVHISIYFMMPNLNTVLFKTLHFPLRIECLRCDHCSVMSDFVTPWTVACQSPLSKEFFRPEYWGG